MIPREAVETFRHFTAWPMLVRVALNKLEPKRPGDYRARLTPFQSFVGGPYVRRWEARLFAVEAFEDLRRADARTQ
jgi:hypothetical protein